MNAVCWYGKEDVRAETVPDPIVKDPKDVILRITTTAICGSDLHLYGGFIPQMEKGDVLGHEFMGEVVEAGPESTLAKGDRVVVPSIFPAESAGIVGKASSRSASVQTLTLRSLQSCTAIMEPVFWLFAPVWRLSRWSGGVCASSLLERWSNQGS